MDLKVLLCDLEQDTRSGGLSALLDQLVSALDENDAAVAWLARRGVTWSGSEQAAQPHPIDAAEDDFELHVLDDEGRCMWAFVARAMGQRLICNILRSDGGFSIRSVGEADVIPEDRDRFRVLLERFSENSP